MNTADQIRLRKAYAKWTRANTAYIADPSKEKAYRKAKQDLWVLKRELHNPHPTHSKNGDAVAELTSLHLSASQPKE